MYKPQDDIDNLKNAFDEIKNDGLEDEEVLISDEDENENKNVETETDIADEEINGDHNNLVYNNIIGEASSAENDESLLENLQKFFDVSKVEEENIHNYDKAVKEGLDVYNIKVDKNFLYSKEASAEIIKNYDSFAVKDRFLNCFIDTLTEYYKLKDFDYINEFILPETETTFSADLTEKLLKRKESVLFAYYMKKLFETDGDFKLENYVYGTNKVLSVNGDLEPDDIREYYEKNLEEKLSGNTVYELEHFYKSLETDFDNKKYITDFFEYFYIPVLKFKLKNTPIDTLKDLKNVCKMIDNHPDLKYTRQARILFAAQKMLSTDGDFYMYEDDIVYDIQNYIENILINDKLLNYNLIRFSSYFDGKINYSKSLNLIINISEGTKTVSLSKTKYEQVRTQTLESSLDFLEWVLNHHHKNTLEKNFRETIKDFIRYNWGLFSANNRSFINMKSRLKNYIHLENVINEVRREEIGPLKSWFYNHGAFLLSAVLSVLLFAVVANFGINFLNGYLGNINSGFVLTLFIFFEVLIIGLLVTLFKTNK